ncbi:MAG TPA: lipopolysaccharide transport periplasmic protein LptA [Casimicrobiaceae bacterium]|nr:lipopolysaccharide transport periplasmic protein LptA [Casimicrobiaceae bacterium]
MLFAFALPILVFTALIPAREVQAERDDKKQNVNYSANTGDFNYQTKVGNLSGNVIITQGTMTIRADKIVFKQNADNSITATATGNPIAFRQKRDGVDEFMEGFAQRADYDGEKELLELFDRALLKRGQDEIRSNYISYNTRTELFRAEGRPDSPSAPADAGPGPRVRGVIQPKSETKDGANNDKASAKENAKPTAPAKPPPGPPLKRAPALESGAAK